MNTISFRNRGLIDLRAVRTFGVSAKDCENPIGFFGTGLKYAIAICTRLDCQVAIYRGTERYSVVVNEATIRGKPFEMIALSNDEGCDELGFTTELGKTWEPWQAFRELYCNTMDEGGECIEGAAEPLADHTTIVVAGQPFHAAYRERDQIILSAKPRWSSDRVEIHERHNPYGYFRGVRVIRLEKAGAMTYNVLSGLDLTEDRTAKNIYQFYGAIRDAVIKSDDSVFIAEFLQAPSDSLEASIDLDTWMTPSEAFLQTLETIGFARCANRSAISLYKRHRKKTLSPDVTPLNRIEEMQLASAIEFCEWARYPVRDYEIVVTAGLDDNTWGLAYEGRIYINRSAFAMGTKVVAGTLIEEYIHLRHKLRDESREIQNHLLNALVGMGELARGEPL